MKIFARRTESGLVPVDETGEAELRKLRPGTVVSVEVKRERNIKFHRMFFALLTLVWDQVDHDRFGSKDSLCDALKMDAGVVEAFRDIRGNVQQKPGSISFASMDEIRFKEFFNRCCDIICAHVLPGMEKSAIKAEISRMVGIPEWEMG